MKLCLVALAAALAVALATAAQITAQPRTTAPPPTVTVKVTITDASITMRPRRAQRGALARFVLLNLGKQSHTFKLGHERHGTGSQTGFTKALRPREQSVHIFFLDYRGKLPYLGALPTDRSKPRMKGVFTIF